MRYNVQRKFVPAPAIAEVRRLASLRKEILPRVLARDFSASEIADRINAAFGTRIEASTVRAIIARHHPFETEVDAREAKVREERRRVRPWQ